MVLYCPLTARPDGFLATVIVTVSAVIGAGLSIRTCSSMNHGLLLVTAALTVAPPDEPPATVRASDTLRAPTVPLAPLIVTVVLPGVAVAAAVSVSVLLLPEVDPGLKLAVTPAGRLPALSATLPVKPPERVMAMDSVPLAPRFTLTAPGVNDSE